MEYKKGDLLINLRDLHTKYVFDEYVFPADLVSVKMLYKFNEIYSLYDRDYFFRTFVPYSKLAEALGV